MASPKSSRTSRHCVYNSGSDCLYPAVTSLPIRTTATPTHVRSIPATLASSSSASSSSTSSTEDSERIFDHSPLGLRADSPTTPPDDLMNTTGSGNSKASTDFEREGTPLVKVRSRPKRPSLVSTAAAADPRYRIEKVTVGPRASRATARRSASPPQIKPLIHTDEIKRLHHSSLAFSKSTSSIPLPLEDVFVGSPQNPHILGSEQMEWIGPNALENSLDVESCDGAHRDKSEQLGDGVSMLEREGSEPDGVQSEGEYNEDATTNFQSYKCTPEDAPKDNPPDSTNLKFIPFRRKDRDLCSINESIIEAMKSHRKAKAAPGWTYVFECPTRAPGHLKIGSTVHMNEREKVLKKCERELIHVKDKDRNAFDYHSIVESLVHQEFHNKRRVLRCICGTNHQEWFEVKKDVALKSICRWRTWVKIQRPYDKEWKLKPYWQWKVRNLPKSLANVDWDDWVRPNRREYYLQYWYEEFGKDYYLALEGHIKRKDKHFCQIGVILLLSMYLLFGGTCFALTMVGLILL
ncbi:uncharacterized protein LY89DRAFT_681410 [Mollisia scopiformis]|uniref:Bacteriophage T5 Orf172 DNA-binding domain-containing protein n=1 Tax=Mollisia scopiformis TaxID=149040 RepID=A0A194XPJ3_MOLSC|nr:uncharacterized protein LY89DRAFT_681410 [Mollisia scopiformis]KUJ22081.1 hypothetical protein LY89DRAFT_681410 [Mollisia scopiformis]